MQNLSFQPIDFSEIDKRMNETNQRIEWVKESIFQEVQINELEEGKLYYSVEFDKSGNPYQRKIGTFLKKNKDSNELHFEDNILLNKEVLNYCYYRNYLWKYYEVNDKVINFIIKFIESENNNLEELQNETDDYYFCDSSLLMLLETFKEHISSLLNNQRGNTFFKKEMWFIDHLKKMNEYILKKNLKKIYINTFEFLINCEFNNNNIIKKKQKNSIGTNLKGYIASYF